MTNEEREALIAQGWTPPVAVDPDLAEARKIYHNTLPTDPMGMTLAAIKRGRELAAAEAKPGMVWVKHDGSSVCPVDPKQHVLARTNTNHYSEARGDWYHWRYITHYAVITPPEDVA